MAVAVPKEEPSLELIQHMADLFGTSFPAAASRFACLSDMPCAFVTMERGAVRYAARSTACGKQVPGYLPGRPFQSAPWLTESVLQEIARPRRVKLHRTSGSTTGKRDLTSGNSQDTTQRTDTTISLLWFDSDDLPEVEVNRFGARVEDDGGLAELTGELPWPGRSRRR